MKSYLRDLRQKVGHDPILLPGAAVLIFNAREELLMMLRNDNGLWGIPGGGMELGEHLEETAIRETWEETGLRLQKITLCDVFSGPELFYCYPNGDKVYNVTAVYMARDVIGEIKLDLDEHTQWAYFPLELLPEKISPPLKVILDRLVCRGE